MKSTTTTSKSLTTAALNTSIAINRKRKSTAISVNNNTNNNNNSNISTGISNKRPHYSDFARLVYAYSKLIPAGKLSTYGNLSIAITGNTKSARAVGSALHYNPFAPIVPCHRIINSNLHIGGFYGSTGINHQQVQRKISLLAGEGVNICNKTGKLLDSNSTIIIPALPKNQLKFNPDQLTDSGLSSV